MQKSKFPIMVLLYILAGALVWVLPNLLGRPDYLDGFFSPNIFPGHVVMIVIHAALLAALQYCFQLLWDNWDASGSGLSLAVIGIFIILALPPLASSFIYMISMGYGSFWESPLLTSAALGLSALLLGFITHALSETNARLS